jgi:3',5'-cyclic AMP phosphodiesterase CpdA
MKKLKLITFIILLVVAKTSFSQYYTEGKTPQRIIINLTATPTKSMAVTWRTVDEVSKPVVEFAEATVWTEIDSVGKPVAATSKLFTTDKRFTVYQHSAIIDGLKSNTLYAYRVGGDSIWSEWNQFRTAKEKAEPFKFVFMGDPQNDLKLHCSRVFREAFKKAPDAAFWLFSGDITSEPEDAQLEGFFYAGGFIFGTTPSIMTPGNHDVDFLWENGKIVRDSKGKKLRGENTSGMFLEHFTLPENGLPGFKETSYTLDYQGVRFIMVDTNLEDKLKEQAVWIENLLANNPNKWTVVSFHHPFYSAGRDRDDDETRKAFLAIFDKYSVDLVLTGHDHAYARSYKLKNGEKVKNNQKGTVYVVSVSGPKMYSVNSNYNHIMAKTGGNVQLYQVISVDNKTLDYKSYTATGELFDSFSLKK